MCKNKTESRSGTATGVIRVYRKWHATAALNILIDNLLKVRLKRNYKQIHLTGNLLYNNN